MTSAAILLPPVTTQYLLSVSMACTDLSTTHAHTHAGWGWLITGQGGPLPPRIFWNNFDTYALTHACCNWGTHAHAHILLRSERCLWHSRQIHIQIDSFVNGKQERMKGGLREVEQRRWDAGKKWRTSDKRRKKVTFHENTCMHELLCSLFLVLSVLHCIALSFLSFFFCNFPPFP